MIEKMKFLSITGPKDDIDRVIDQYLSKYEIHLENAMSELKTVENLRPFQEANPYKAELQTANELAEAYLSPESPQNISAVPSLEEAVSAVHALDDTLKGLSSRKDEIQKELDELLSTRNAIFPFSELNYDLRSIFHFKYVKYRFGRIPHEYYQKFMTYVYDTIDTILCKCREDADYVWVVYFVPEPECDKTDAIFASLHFERFRLQDVYEGTPTEAAQSLDKQISALQTQLDEADARIRETVETHRQELLAARQRLTTFSSNFDVRRLAACTKEKDHTFYILCGWMAESDADRFREELKSDARTFCLVEDDHNNIMSKPPTKLKNPRLFRPFEMFISMYGLPSYDEIDPTILLALTYSFLFGFMFGDVGQGLCLLVGGLVLYKVKKMNLAAIISCCGFFSTIFGFLFGSVFGFENILEPVWLRPKEAMTNLPFIGNLNTVFVVAVALGMGIILITMVLNVINSLRAHDCEKTWFDANGVAGIVFYASLVITIFLFMSGHALPASVILTVMFLIPLLIIFFKEPLAAFIEKKSELLPEGKGMFIVQGFFELFEVCLSYFSNTLSFVRVGAFAVSHAAMMEVVLMLAGAEAGSPNWLVVVLGNLFVCGMEGLIVGIQVLRLEYYELFSRFYHGTGRPFRPYGKA